MPREPDQTLRHLRAEVDLDDRLVVRLEREPRQEPRVAGVASDSSNDEQRY